MEDVGRLDGRPDHQRGSGDAPGGGVCVWAGSGRLEGNLSLWKRLRPEGDSLSAAEGETGEMKGMMGKWYVCFDTGYWTGWFITMVLQNVADLYTFQYF